MTASACGAVAVLVRKNTVPTAAAPIAKSAPTTKATWYPPTSAASAPLPDARRLSVCDAAMLASTARPSAPPIMNAVFTTPDARPGLLRLDVAHRREQQRVERHAGADAGEDHRRQDVHEEAPADRRMREEQQARPPRAAARSRAAASRRSA